MTLQAAVAPRSKLPDVGATIFSVIGELVNRYQAINLSQGAPSFSPDPKLIDGVTAAMQAGFNQYAPMNGVVSLKEILAEKVKRLYHRQYDVTDEITIAGSASEGIYASISALVHPGDEVIYFEPAFDSYSPVIRLQGAVPVPIRLQLPEFAINWDEVAATVTPKTRMIIINTPHNPSGQVLSADDLQALARITHDTGIMILSDEVYEHIIFDGKSHCSMATHSELANRSVIVSSFGKTFHVTGWRVGYCLAPKALMDEIRKVHQFLMYAADTPFQHAIAEYMCDPQTYLTLSSFYQQKRDLLVSELANSPLQLLPCSGSFFMLASYQHLSDESDLQLVQRLIRENRVATIPLSAFYADGYDPKLIRLSFAKDEQTIRQGAQALSSVTFARG
ncbi:methionine aminotransferase [Celerinatantimonas sp. YJH-8]|uniref:methionine aminotransferase n=1 Tax=Celerinatantimonas sp. YJH-8 TaxID=3228714 RepID=UPI0038C96B31